MTTIAWIGLGRMGLPMSTHLVKSGFKVVGFDVSQDARDRAAQAGLTMANSLPEAVEGADAIFTMLPDGDYVLDVYSGPSGILANAKRDALLVDSSTVAISTCRKVHELSEDGGYAMLDAPVSGGTMGAEAATLTFMVGGNERDYENSLEFLKPMARNIFHTGGPTTGQVAKICNNLILFINLASTAEGAVLAEKLGLDKNVFFDIASVSSADSWPLRNWYPIPGVVAEAASSRNFEQPTFTARLARKDVSLAVEAAKELGESLLFGEIVQGLYDRLIEDGLGDKDCSIVSKLMRD
jgi:3-hydroxyisobutyrate dehydrogenase